MKLNEMLSGLGRPVIYYPELARCFGGTKAALFLCQFAYWSGKEKDGDGWMYKSMAEIEQETALSTKEQQSARRKLKKMGVLEEKKVGIPALNHYRFDWERVDELFKSYSEKGKNGLTSDAKRARLEMPKGHDWSCQKGTTIPYSTTESTTEKRKIIGFQQEGDQGIEQKDNGIKVPYKEFVATYNRICDRLVQCKVVTEKRRRQIGSRWKEHPEMSFWEDVFEKTNSNPFLAGENERGWRADIDFILSPSKLANIIEGKYEQRRRVCL